MVGKRHAAAAIAGLRGLNADLLAAGGPGRAPLHTDVYERDHQRAILSAIQAAGLPAKREVRLPNWAGTAWGRVDFLTYDGPVPKVESSSPIQYKPSWASVGSVVEDLFYLGMWWPGASRTGMRRAVWYSSVHRDAGKWCVAEFDSWLRWARTHDARTRCRWSQLVTAWRPIAELRFSLPIRCAGDCIGWLHHIEVVGAGPTPAHTAGVPDSWPVGMV